MATPVTILSNPIALPIIFLSTISVTQDTDIIWDDDLCIPQNITPSTPLAGHFSIKHNNAQNNARNDINKIFVRPNLSDKLPAGYEIKTETKLKKPIAPAQNHSGNPDSLKFSNRKLSGARANINKNIIIINIQNL